jgi:hypothetical protein
MKQSLQFKTEDPDFHVGALRDTHPLQQDESRLYSAGLRW